MSLSVSATSSLSGQNGSTRIRQAGKHAWIVSTVIRSARAWGRQ
jgi:hypothetical protein